MGGASAPRLSAQIAAIGHKSVGAEAPPTRAGGPGRPTWPAWLKRKRKRPRQAEPFSVAIRARWGANRCSRGPHAAGRETQSSPLDRSSSATTSAAAHSRASRSLRSRSAFSTASM
ncbi:DUF6053 domain-containing protein [Lysobacter enzymogenes]|uniref:DUF6053 domain-containing protein n=1 Tax=Lysobacter enzymogenes TaxID=69 RepID=UPI00339A64A9